jgi:hypothetical protein
MKYKMQDHEEKKAKAGLRILLTKCLSGDRAAAKKLFYVVFATDDDWEQDRDEARSERYWDQGEIMNNIRKKVKV